MSSRAGPGHGGVTPPRDDVLPLLHAERTALVADLEHLPEQRWATPSLCAGMSVRDVVAHLTAGGSQSFPRWFLGLARARFDADRMVAGQVRDHLGADAADTLARFRAVVTSTTVPSRRHLDAWLGELVVHGEDVRRPLGIVREHPADVLTRVARFYASRDFTVASRTAVDGLRLEATDGPFRHGDGPVVRGRTLALVMSMAGRSAYLDELEGDGVPTLRRRVSG
jgi:uncharacterized protein (TIGR03083 family)